MGGFFNTLFNVAFLGFGAQVAAPDIERSGPGEGVAETAVMNLKAAEAEYYQEHVIAFVNVMVDVSKTQHVKLAKQSLPLRWQDYLVWLLEEHFSFPIRIANILS